MLSKNGNEKNTFATRNEDQKFHLPNPLNGKKNTFNHVPLPKK